MLYNAVGYRGWLEPGVSGQSGLAALYVVAERVSRSLSGVDPHAAPDAVARTYEEIRGRLQRCVELTRAGRSVPDFRRPEEALRRNVARYHSWQVRRRLRGTWRAPVEALPLWRRGDFEGDVDAELLGDPDWGDPAEGLEVRSLSWTLHFAVAWVMVDAEAQDRAKGGAWWWKMLAHVFDLSRTYVSDRDRNDPGEASLRLRLRGSAAIGLAPWLHRWIRGRPRWQSASFGLPERDDQGLLREVASALEVIRPALLEAIGGLEAAAASERGRLA